ncbi:helix-turn-helix transcriptional regulator [Kitasatospora sp. NPDC048540]|uniref:helix-turn-helix transcriptional regulator n=1 Tax=Kitasatospora sp. NPDC048540 TaxID=3155634 RepID=UPI0033E2AA38
MTTTSDHLTAGTRPPPRREQRRDELATFLRARRARIQPEDVGLPAGQRRRTPGLRREELAQLAGVGITWYTRLEQGRPVDAAERALDAVARTLRLDRVEREHLFRLAGVEPAGPAGPRRPAPDPAVELTLAQLDPLPAAVGNSRHDLLLTNRSYDLLFPRTVAPATPDGRRNSIWCAFTTPACCTPFVRPDEELSRMVAALRAAYGRHVGEPAWEGFLGALAGVSARFRTLWERRDAAPPYDGPTVLRHPGIGEVRLRAARLGAPAGPEGRLTVYTPWTPGDRALLERLHLRPPAAPAPHAHGPEHGLAPDAG